MCHKTLSLSLFFGHKTSLAFDNGFPFSTSSILSQLFFGWYLCWFSSSSFWQNKFESNAEAPWHFMFLCKGRLSSTLMDLTHCTFHLMDWLLMYNPSSTLDRTIQTATPIFRSLSFGISCVIYQKMKLTLIKGFVFCNCIYGKKNVINRIYRITKNL